MEEDEDPCYSNLQLSKEDKGRIEKPWRQMLIIKLLGRSIGYLVSENYFIVETERNNRPGGDR